MIETLPQRGKESPQLRFPSGNGHHLDFRAGQIAIRGQQGQVRHGRLERELIGILQGGPVDCREHVVDSATGRGLSSESDSAGQVRLGIDIDEEDAPVQGGECGGQIDRGRGLADAALLVDDRLYLLHHLRDGCFGLMPYLIWR